MIAQMFTIVQRDSPNLPTILEILEGSAEDITVSTLSDRLVRDMEAEIDYDYWEPVSGIFHRLPYTFKVAV